MTKLEKKHRELNEAFNDRLAEVMYQKFSVDVETHLDIISLSKFTVRSDGEDFTEEQHAFLRGFSEGYADAMGQVHD